ncbi:hypothetical protein [Mycoplana sp. MJR14]|uniref:hypothetical protein n=1 Tax=Mycoplana sp. MJR14 TaxID=3032583 RepID=UPI0023DB2B0E|nr:hypothetical protein [Mycoplana sp. MJR14]MDF1634159.1 hypothetical protein [Mycoplana sp. MJR14]
MPRTNSSKNHHWWPVALQRYWADSKRDVSWIEPDGRTDKKKFDNRKIGYKIHGHTILKGTVWESSFENEFDIDNEIHNIVRALKALAEQGKRPSELIRMAMLFFKRDRKLRDMCNFHDMDDNLHRLLLTLIYSLLIRCPAARFRYEEYPRLFGFRPSENVGKANMLQSYRTAKKLCEKSISSNQKFVILHSPMKNFLFGDGLLDWLTVNENSYRISGKALIPLTPNICIYFCTTDSITSNHNCASLIAPNWIVDRVNEITQIYSRDKIFYLGKPPQIINSFRQNEFLEFENKSNDFIDILDEIFLTSTSSRTFKSYCRL